MDITYQTALGTFEWDSDKEAINIRKHGLSFKEAVEVFADPMALLIRDDEHSEGEIRFVAIGSLQCEIVAFVVFTEREFIRIISARRATAAERRRYAENY